MPTLEDLKFTKAELTSANGPLFTCNDCGKLVRYSATSYFADFPIDETSHYTFFLCDSFCMVSFHLIRKRHIVNKFIQDNIKWAAEMHFVDQPELLKQFLIKHNLT